MDAAAQKLSASGASAAASYSQCSDIRVRQRKTEQPFSIEALWPCYTVNTPTYSRVSLSAFNVQGRRLVLGSTGYRWAADRLAPEFANGGLVAHGQQLDRTKFTSR
ncbi:hypothetical protein GCM10010298_36550 [Streptomyces microflavus]|uniref:Uncharacterized protein n=1 Tax=Streptomyces microflavus TaxID=1919 RepID=A0A7J0D3U1_STRMI|nr:hypothetical protein Smic_79380 [Streptomyces microflavus]GGX68266.1 hypothetical protein GCM10010298_36550 [Streptomyces microflavus]